METYCWHLMWRTNEITWPKTTIRGVCILAALFGSVLAQPPGNRPPDKPASPASLPGDTLPPFGMLDSAGNSLRRRIWRRRNLASHRPPVSIRGPALDLAIEAARAAVDTCAAGGFYIGATVIDTSGQPRAAVEAEGSDGGHVYVAVRKALVALTFKMPSSQAAMAVQTDKALLAQVAPNMFVMEGAVGLEWSEARVSFGAIGASGAAGGDPEAGSAPSLA